MRASFGIFSLLTVTVVASCTLFYAFPSTFYSDSLNDSSVLLNVSEDENDYPFRFINAIQPESCEGDRFLVANIYNGRVTNQLIYLWRNMMLASMLNRTLVITPFTTQYRSMRDKRFVLQSGLRYPMDYYEEVALLHCNPCAITYDVFLKQRNLPLTLICAETPCNAHNKDLGKMAHITVSKTIEGMSYLDVALRPELQSEPTVAISVRYDTNKWKELDKAFKGVLSEQCAAFGWWAPAKKFWRAINVYSSHMIGGPYLAVHWRMEDFQAEAAYQHFSIKYFAEMMILHLQVSNLSTLFLATNANSTEVLEFLSEMRMFRVLTSRVLLAIYYDDPVLPRTDLSHEEDLNDHVVLEKEVCARATVFKGSVKSTFSYHIQAIRESRKKDHTLDGNWHEKTRTYADAKREEQLRVRSNRPSAG
mmetsp:Transcript_38389/g.62218  ORF Transcript_38389/g.62218 Transcript_38389/m.62218 type:complete len:420 (-) Transcript_38389:441-1700(-)